MPLEISTGGTKFDLTAVRTRITLRTLQTLSTRSTCGTGLALLTCNDVRLQEVDYFTVFGFVLDPAVFFEPSNIAEILARIDRI